MSKATDIYESKLIKQLASNDDETREAALEALTRFVSQRDEFSHNDIMRLWRGLFYCMWMADRPLRQQRLADELAALVQRPRKDGVTIAYLRAFWATMALEWPGMDQFRLDKYYLLMRRMCEQGFAYMHRRKWDADAVEQYMQVMSEGPLSVEDPSMPNGIRFHVMEIYLDSLEKLPEFNTSSERKRSRTPAVPLAERVPLDALLAPVEKLASDSPVKVVRIRAKDMLSDPRISEWRGISNDSVSAHQSEEHWQGIDGGAPVPEAPESDGSLLRIVNHPHLYKMNRSRSKKRQKRRN